MLIENQEITIKWSPKTKQHYIDRGYEFTKYKDTFNIKISDLPLGSDYEIKYICDYCGDIAYRKYEVYNKVLNKSQVKKDTCQNRKCVRIKTEEQNLLKYGVKDTMELKEVRDKIANTNMVKYGVKNVFESQKFQDKAKETIRERYGVDNVFESEEIKNQIKRGNLEKYGAEHHMSLPKYQGKARETRIKNHGKYFTKASQTFINGIACSKKQLELGKFLDGEINKSINNKVVDIYLNDLNLVIEYDGKGHNLGVVFGQITQEEFDLKENIRNKEILNEGLTILRVVNTKDKKFDNEVVLAFIVNNLIVNSLNILTIS